MQIHGFKRHAHKSLFGALSAMIAIPGFATQPLIDLYTDGKHTGHIFPSKCCHVELPSNERIREMRRNELTKCTAAGGPVGVFKLEAGKLWLTALYKCSGEVPLNEMYPGMEAPVVATWLTGLFRTRLDFACYDEGVQPIYAVSQTLIVEKGVLKSKVEKRGDTAPARNKTTLQTP